MSGIGLLLATPLTGGIGLLGHSLSTALPVPVKVDLGDVIDHARELTRQASGLPGQLPGGADPPSLPTQMPAPPPPPPAPAEQQSGGSSISTGSHHHNKGGSFHAVLGGALLVLYLRPLVLSRLASSSGFSRSFRPLALPG